MTEVSLLLALALLTLQNRIENLLHAVSFFSISSSLLCPCKICPSHHVKQTINKPTHLSSLPWTPWGCLVAMGSFLAVALSIRFWAVQGENFLSVGTSFSRWSSPRLFWMGSRANPLHNEFCWGVKRLASMVQWIYLFWHLDSSQWMSFSWPHLTQPSLEWEVPCRVIPCL